ncbi:hypothetical protein ACFY2R_08725 [Micromonospora olivasterospora]|uniref:Mce-associated membrane protein n=1 Tax=Micromonospora olivasterospora TaxID=1880 RepID=A0A562I7M5_MICOL|nr:hypothetical protein [Micromonospora olivasterospora]TWH66989.1 hypothetical protein JD77_01950 [Micromonospora olivasterospora]
MQPPAGSQVSRVPAQRTPPDQLAPQPLAPAPVRPPRRLWTALTVVAGVAALLLLGGVVAAFVWYDRATTPDRSAPDVVVDNYLRAFLVERNDVKAKQFTCTKATLEAVSGLRGELVAREARFATTIFVSWGKLDLQEQGDAARVQVDLIFSASVDGVSQSDRQPWQFSTTRADDGWRVCDGTSVS